MLTHTHTHCHAWAAGRMSRCGRAGQSQRSSTTVSLPVQTQPRRGKHGRARLLSYTIHQSMTVANPPHSSSSTTTTPTAGPSWRRWCRPSLLSCCSLRCTTWSTQKKSETMVAIQLSFCGRICAARLVSSLQVAQLCPNTVCARGQCYTHVRQAHGAWYLELGLELACNGTEASCLELLSTAAMWDERTVPRQQQQ